MVPEEIRFPLQRLKLRLQDVLGLLPYLHLQKNSDLLCLPSPPRLSRSADPDRCNDEHGRYGLYWQLQTFLEEAAKLQRTRKRNLDLDGLRLVRDLHRFRSRP